MPFIILDFDGVVVQSRRPDGSFLWSQNIEEDLGISSKVMSEIFASDIWSQILVGKIEFESHLQSVFNLRKLSLLPKDFTDYWLKKDLIWYSEVIETLRSLQAQGHTLLLATNQDALRTSHLRKNPVIKEIFSGVYSSADLGCAKPAPLFFAKLLTLLGPECDTAIFIDDTSANISAAQDAGLLTIRFDPDLDSSASVAQLNASIAYILQ